MGWGVVGGGKGLKVYWCNDDFQGFSAWSWNRGGGKGGEGVVREGGVVI